MTKSKPSQFRIDEQRKAAYQEAADKAGMSLSDWLCWCADANLPKSVAKKLPERKMGRPKST